MHAYRLFGLTFHSEIPLPELIPAPAGSVADVTIEHGTVPRSDGDFAHGLISTPEGAVFTVRPVGRFRMSGGNRIEIDAKPDADPARLRLFLLGSAIGATLLQRGMRPLHANAIDMGGYAIAFTGPSQAGKSTLAAAFHDRGHRLLSDDVCVITPGADSGYDAQPGLPRMRLWADAIERTGRDAEALDVAVDGLDKFVVPTVDAQPQTALPLRAIFVLTKGDDAVSIRPVTGMAAAKALITNTYRAAFVPAATSPADHLDRWLGVVRTVPIFELARPWDAERIGETIDAVEAHLAG
ncbi:hypothetical protein P1X14_10285 [Sphingomonas sp. AOB5]|uniref:hypothetical protein n=1 Tax=Sphingomonas sp. AOB5 TaxID=3034017 RepID=UPI0023F8A18E|nr:hypothetical protein [Sphingomonas sp. AOB5]MDF7775635.1 hypothetical protein [Sphingomonas sp. AOB5]